MITRQAEDELILLSQQFKCVAIVGPRQSGKTTLVKKAFAKKPYVNLEDPDDRVFAVNDPRGFLSNYPQGAIIDEAQKAPDLFSYLQQILDDKNKRGLFILTGSNNFLLQENITQSLAGRVGYLFLLPCTISELNNFDHSNSVLYKGLYPELYNQEVSIRRFYANYIRTYVERDVRLLKNIGNLNTFESFLRLCAGRIGQLLNMSNLANDVGVDVKTIESWISVLEASFIAFRLRPYHKNFNKRIVKTPKLYFTDTGLACALLGLESDNQLKTHPLRGNLFENLIIVEFLKQRYNKGKTNNLFFWRDNIGNEIDLVYDQYPKPIPIEIKAGKTISSDYFKGLAKWEKMSADHGGYIIYDGDVMQKRSNGIEIIPFSKLPDYFSRLFSE